MNAVVTTAVALVLLSTGLAGYPVGRHARFVNAPWSDTVIWWQVLSGLALLSVAAWLWRAARLKYAEGRLYSRSTRS